jgi:hypothetical protein
MNDTVSTSGYRCIHVRIQVAVFLDTYHVLVITCEFICFLLVYFFLLVPFFLLVHFVFLGVASVAGAFFVLTVIRHELDVEYRS